MENSTEHKHHKKDNTILFYILGGLVVTVVIIAGFLLYRPQTTIQTVQPTNSQQNSLQTQPTTALPIQTEKPISTLACSQQYYNTVNGVPGNYYLSTEGEVPSTTTSVTCTITASVNDKIVATEKITPELISVPARNGSTFRCTTKGMKLTPNVPTKVIADIIDNAGNSVSCTRTFLLP